MLDRYAIKVVVLGNAMVLTEDHGWARKRWTFTRSIETSEEEATRIVNQLAAAHHGPDSRVIQVWSEKLKEKRFDDRSIGARIKKQIQENAQARHKKG